MIWVHEKFIVKKPYCRLASRSISSKRKFDLDEWGLSPVCPKERLALICCKYFSQRHDISNPFYTIEDLICQLVLEIQKSWRFHPFTHFRHVSIRCITEIMDRVHGKLPENEVSTRSNFLQLVAMNRRSSKMSLNKIDQNDSTNLVCHCGRDEGLIEIKYRAIS